MSLFLDINYRITQMKKLTYIPTLFLILISIVSYGQETAAAGGEAIGVDGFSSYSIGQILYSTHTGSNEFIIQGVQQPYEISEITGIQDEIGVQSEINLFPNPTENDLSLSIIDSDISFFQYFMYDMNGKLLHSNSVSKNTVPIVMNNLSKGGYIIRIMKNSKEVKTFKVLKK